MVRLSRRLVLLLGALAPVGCAPAAVPRRESPFDALEAKIGGRVGVFALDTASGARLEHRADERFAMCSTFKWALAAAVLARVDRGELALDDPIAFGESDLLEYAPATRANVARGQMTIEALADAIVTISDNTAANLLLREVGGPAGLTAFMRSLGDEETRLDRDEPMLNTNLPDDPRDTTTPRAMVGALRAALLGDVLSAPSRALLLGWLERCETGRARLRAGFPPDWRVGDKTGTGNRGACNDVAIATAPGAAPILVAAYVSDGAADKEALEAAHASVASVVAAELGPAQ
ncbi:MAG: class A beta-lactamase [Myxococcales bacterium]|nr:class A beta-lactamase [Myxococcales bacterium]